MARTTKDASSSATLAADVLELFHPVTAAWFRAVFEAPTPPQVEGWPAIARGESTLILAPTGTGKTLTAFLWCLDKLMLQTPAEKQGQGVKVLYLSPLKALAVDVERNLRSPLAGIANQAQQMEMEFYEPVISVRTGDTSQLERARFRRHPGDILITTPESLYLLLTSEAGEALRSVETVIIDEIHALVPTKRGAHMAMSLERLEALCGRRLQRIGLSATQRPLEEVARFLGGAESRPPVEETQSQPGGEEPDEVAAGIRFRPVTIVNAGARKRLELRVEVPVEDMARLGEVEDLPSGPASQGPKRTSIWQSIHPRLLEIIRQHESTILFVNARRIAERLAGAINDLAGEQIARAHHGSLAASQRSEIEEMLKEGRLKALVATSSLELGIDMGAVDLVIQIEAPPSVASGLQRIGRAGHTVGAPSSGIIFPKYRADLVACAAVTRAMHEGHVEATRFLRNPLDVLAQQIVAVVSQPPMDAETAEGWRTRRREESPGIGYDALFDLVRGCANFAGLSRTSFDGVLDMLAGRYPSDEFAELRPRVTWDRTANWLLPREGVKRIAILNAGTIPDRGLYGVFLSGERAKPVRVGELDEEMVFESRTGDTFVLGASTWRIDEITHDRVLVSPAPGEPGKMPFWHGDGAGRPLEFGRRIGQLVRELRDMPRPAAVTKLTREHDLDPMAAENVLRYLADQEIATRIVPDDRNLVIERVRDELGDWRVCVLTPFGSRIHAPWAMAATARVKAANGGDVETMWSEDGLWQQRKRAYDLLAVASRYAEFPILLEAYRECLRDVFDLPALREILALIARRDLRVHTVDSRTPSPFASALLFSYVANYIYDGDAPLAERRAQALSIDQEQLRELMGDADLRELLDAAAIAETEEQLQLRAEGYRARNADGVHDLLLRLGDLRPSELLERVVSPEVALTVDRLKKSRRVLEINIASDKRLIAVEDAARYRDALGIPLPPGLPAAFLEKTQDALTDLVRRYARTHGPFTTAEAARRFALPAPQVEATLQRLVQVGRVVEGGFRPEGSHREWCDVEVLRTIRRKSLAKLRKEVEPVEQRVLARFFTNWQGVVTPRRGLDAVLDAVENLQGSPVPASLLENEILPARIATYKPADLDTLIAAGEVIWTGVEPLGERDGRVGLYLADKLPLLWTPRPVPELAGKELQVVEYLQQRGATFFAQLLEGTGGGYPGDLLDALWSLVWKGLVTNDSLHALRAYSERSTSSRVPARRIHNQQAASGFRSRRTTPPTGQGRWALNAVAFADPVERATHWSHAMAQQLLARYGIVFRETAHAENLPGGFSAIYDVLKAMEESGKIRRGYFAADLGAVQFALPAALDLLRTLRNKVQQDEPEMLLLAATDPANPYGSLLRWPAAPDAASTLTRSVGGRVVLCDGALAAYLRRGNPNVQVFLPEEDPARTQMTRSLAQFFAEVVGRKEEGDEHRSRAGMLIATVNGVPVAESPMAKALLEVGFVAAPIGFNLRKRLAPVQQFT
ncbi:DEAD/DEAH box helicase [Terriglobus sp. YAF25]|uniref:Lhr family helicase n=1 Tax=Terriglobus sp. YAF25 TaxID=3233080 RepID=UPI003F986E50